MVSAELITGLVALLFVWVAMWKALALWRCGRNNQPFWFVAVLLLNTLGILPILYLMFFQKNKAMKLSVAKTQKPAKKKARRKK